MKFSARSFTADCIKYRCTTMQYIGELCRYLINAPPNPSDSKVGLRAVMGNGMRPDVWVQFQARYGIKRVIEFYAATEGNCAFFNSTGKVGALGYMPDMFTGILPAVILRVDPLNKENPIRDANGHCVRASPGEVGLLCARIDQKQVGRRFDGYSDKAATSKKILTNVLKDGDSYFNSGDLLSTKGGYYFWSDRVGDTFRWKGENVATTEVENALGACAEIDDVSVYGVEIPNCDGRVGMAALILKDGVSVSDSSWSQSLIQECEKNLAAYSRPAFLRVQTSAVVTATFKHQKASLVKEGFDPANAEIVKSGDKLYFYSQRKKEVVPLDDDLYSKIIKSEVQV
jgi:fatty-acyl-CoA synthase